MKIALTGGIACGKSLFAKFLRELGIHVLDADDVVHDLEAPGGAAVQGIVARFGTDVLAPDGGIDRPALAARIFSDSSARADLESIVFPLVRERMGGSRLSRPNTGGSRLSRPNTGGSRLSQPNTGGSRLSRPNTGGSRSCATAITIHIIPLLFESHWETDYDILICIASPVDLQIDRMMTSRGYSRAHAEARLAAQWSVSEKAARCHYTVKNDSTPEHLRDEAKRLVAWLKEQIENER